ncbi:MAG TPA: hypothetical protein ACFCUY_01850 [Xenococcaceae cyanobacterium]|jgi:hypothetical protein
MASKTTTKNRYFCIFDYYLDGVFLRWEEVQGECPVMIQGQNLAINLEDGTQITAKIVETETISDNERRIFLSSL